MKGVDFMTQKPPKGRKTLRIVLTVIISAVLLCVLTAGGTAACMATPHTKHFTSISKVSNKKIDGKYLYHAGSNGAVYILRSDTDIALVPGNGGGHDIKVRATGIDIYRTDTSGIFTAYPVISYEYVAE